MGPPPILIGIILWGGTLKTNVTKTYGPDGIIFKHILRGYPPHGNNAGSRRGDTPPSTGGTLATEASNGTSFWVSFFGTLSWGTQVP